VALGIEALQGGWLHARTALPSNYVLEGLGARSEQIGEMRVAAREKTRERWSFCALAIVLAEAERAG
jgi:hypothetical protein